jgi:LPS-assembly protein
MGWRMNIFKRFLFWIISGLLLLMFAVQTLAGSLDGLLKTDPDIPWKIQADTVEYDSNNDSYIATGSVVIVKGDRRLSADFVRFDQKTMNADARGRVLMSAGEDLLMGERIEINLTDETGTLYDGNIFIGEKHFYIKGDEIKKVGEKEYQAYKASITACDGEQPDWKITGKNLDITLEGYGTIQHGAFWVRDIPVLYVPFFIFPVKTRRQSGFLIPEAGSSDRRGVELTLPFYWAIDESSDVTVTNHYMTKRGYKTGVEYRYVLEERSSGTMMLDYLDDQKIDDGSGNSGQDWGYDDDRWQRTNSDRYWFRMKADQALPQNFFSRLDLDIVSDQDYLKEFQSGYSGYDQTRQYFSRNFGRDLDDYNDPIRANRFNLNRIWQNYSFHAELLWYDNVILRRWADTDPTLQRLPFVTVNSSRQIVPGTPFYWNVDTQYTYFYRKDGATGHRVDAAPRISLPWRFKEYFFVEPSAGFRETLWYMDTLEHNNTGDDRDHHREMADFAFDVNTRLSRIYGGNTEGLRHIIRPRILYEYVPDRDQDDYPFFDPLDRIEKKNRITLELINTLALSDLNSPAPSPRLCRFELDQSYDFEEYESPDGSEDYFPPDRSAPEDGEHLSPLYGKLEISPVNFLSLRADAEWSHRDQNLFSRNLALSLRDDRGDSFQTEYRYTRDTAETLNTRFNVNISPKISAYAEYERNIKDNDNIKTGLGIWYKTQCWSVTMRYLIERDDHSYGVMVNLHGLGGMNTN